MAILNKMLTEKFILDELDKNQFNTLVIAYSGGIDSHALLHLLAFSKELRNKYTIQAIHVNHGLQQQANQWAEHCLATCKSYDISCEIIHLDCTAHNGKSLQAHARQMRYQALFAALPAKACLLTAHHQDDQAETVLLQLLRGAGVHGLAAMPLWQQSHDGMIFRPFVQTVTRTMIEDYAQKNQLQWVDDPSNDKTHYERNFLRLNVIPSLKQHWPSLSKTLTRSARVCAQTSDLLDDIAQHDLLSCQCNDGSLEINSLKRLSIARQNNSLRFWLQKQSLPMPSEAQLQQIHQQCCDSRHDAEPSIVFPTYQLRRFDSKIYCIIENISEKLQAMPWDLQKPLQLPHNMGKLVLERNVNQGLYIPPNAKITVKFRQGGERCHPYLRVGSHPLKKLMQEWKIPPWLRDKIPLIYINDELAQVVGYCLCEPFVEKEGQEKVMIIRV